MHIFTVFCQEADGTGTIWIGSVEAQNNDAAEAIRLGRAACANDWGIPAEEAASEIHVLGVAVGNVEIVHWQDVCDTE